MTTVKWTGCMSCQEAALMQPPEGSVLIGIRDPDQVHPNYVGRWDDVLRLNFWDVDHPVQGYDPATQEQVKEIWDFIQKHKEKHIFAHCEAGVSRSGAIREYLVGQGWARLKATRVRQVHPNQHVAAWLRYFDRGGEEYQWPVADTC